MHRLEYPFLVHYLSHAALGVSYAVQDIRQLYATPVLLVIVANLLVIVAGNPLNAAVDIATDSRTEGKRDIAEAVRRLGHHHVIRWAAVEMTLALLLAAAISMMLNRPLLALGIAAIALLCLAYNLEPVRLKRRGFANPITIGLCLGFLPSFVGYSAVRDDLDGTAWVILVGYGFLITGRALWWTMPDRTGDSATGMITPVVRYGVIAALSIACVFTLTGLGLFSLGLWQRYGPMWAFIGGAVIGTFVIGKLALLPRISDDRLPSSQQLRRRSLASATITDLFLVLLPLTALGR